MSFHRASRWIGECALPLGSVDGVGLSLHVSFFLVIPLGLVLSAGDVRWSIALTVCVFMFTLVHAVGHLVAVRAMGGTVHELVLWPLGGLGAPELPLRPMVHCLAALAGPLVHLVIYALFLPWALMHPSPAFWPDPASGAMALLFSVNQLLLIANLLPVFFTDGGRIWQAVLWRFVGFRKATLLTLAASFVLAAVLLVHAVVGGSIAAGVFGAMALVSSAYYAVGVRVAERVDGLWVETPGLLVDWYRTRRVLSRVRHWFGKRRQERRHLQLVRDAHELDALLSKIQRVGIAGLTPRERRFLDRQSERLQRR